MNGNNMFSNILDPFSNGRSSNNVLSSYGGFNLDASNPIDIFNNSGNQNLRNHISNSNSPHTNSSSCSPQSVGCGQCDNGANNRCLDCNAAFCDNCIQEHNINAYTKNHTVVGLGKITPIGSVTSTTSMMQSLKVHPLFEPQCDIHFEALRFLCETCKKVVCQECTLMDHKDHEQTPIGNITTEMAKERLRAVFNNSVLGTQHVRKSIDHAVAYSQSIERDSQEIQSRIKKSFRLMTLAAEDRERALVELIEKFRQQKVANLSDQMTGLRSALGELLKNSTSS
jgi:B-box zinc finger